MKKINKKEINEKVNIAKVVSVMGQKKFQTEVTREMLQGTPSNEAQELIAGMKWKRMI